MHWGDVPFLVRTGKSLARRLTEISVHFKPTPRALFARTPDEQIDPNVITLGIQPHEGIAVKIGAKKPAAQMLASRAGRLSCTAENYETPATEGAAMKVLGLQPNDESASF